MVIEHSIIQEAFEAIRNHPEIGIASGGLTAKAFEDDESLFDEIERIVLFHEVNGDSCSVETVINGFLQAERE